MRLYRAKPAIGGLRSFLGSPASSVPRIAPQVYHSFAFATPRRGGASTWRCRPDTFPRRVSRVRLRLVVDESVSAPEVARRLGVRPGTFRAWLRRQWRAGHPLLRAHHLSERYRFSPDVARQLAAQYRVSQQR